MPDASTQSQLRSDRPKWWFFALIRGRPAFVRTTYYLIHKMILYARCPSVAGMCMRYGAARAAALLCHAHNHIHDYTSTCMLPVIL
eukprot:364133-Chlamydomonas_euryale.AAC.17